MAVVIRPLVTSADFRLLTQAEAAVWGQEEAIPYHQSMVAARCGGVALGAFDGTAIVGFAYGFPAYDGQAVWLHSHILGVLPEYRGTGLGARLKWAQREQALAKGYNLMTWTYDPLEAANAHLNLNRLGGVVRRFLPNYYGSMSDVLNQGLPSDRVWLEWHLRSERVERLARDPAAAAVPGVRGVQAPLEVDPWSPGGWPAPRPAELQGAPAAVAVPVPWGFQELKRQNPALARRWREEVRKALQHCLENGYAAVDFAAPPDQRTPGGLCHYWLRKDVSAHAH